MVGLWRPAIAVAAMMFLGGCGSDPKAVITFAAMAPNPNDIKIISRDWVHEPQEREDRKVLLNTETIDISNEVAARTVQAAAIENNDRTIRAYMQALGVLAGGTAKSDAKKDTTMAPASGSATTPSTDPKTAASSAASELDQGLEAWQGTTKLSKPQSDAIGSLLADLINTIEAEYRAQKLSEFIEKYHTPFQDLLLAQGRIAGAVADQDSGVLGQLKSLNRVSEKMQAGLEISAKTPPNHRDVGRNGSSGLAPKSVVIADANLADARATLFLFKNSLSAETEEIDIRLVAASEYQKALTAIASAETKLNDNRDKLLTDDLVSQIKQDAEDAFKAYSALETAPATAAPTAAAQ